MNVISLIRPACPHCDGKGGFMDGYYEPEFSGWKCEADMTSERPKISVWCVKHRDGWCAAKPNRPWDERAFNIGTLTFT